MDRKESPNRAIYYGIKVPVFIALLYAVDYTPLRPERIVAFFHLGTFGSFVLGLFGLCVTWWFAGVMMGLMFLAFGLLCMAFVKNESPDRTQA